MSGNIITRLIIYTASALSYAPCSNNYNAKRRKFPATRTMPRADSVNRVDIIMSIMLTKSSTNDSPGEKRENWEREGRENREKYRRHETRRADLFSFASILRKLDA